MRTVSWGTRRKACAGVENCPVMRLLAGFVDRGWQMAGFGLQLAGLIVQYAILDIDSSEEVFNALATPKCQ